MRALQLLAACPHLRRFDMNLYASEADWDSTFLRIRRGSPGAGFEWLAVGQQLRAFVTQHLDGSGDGSQGAKDRRDWYEDALAQFEEKLVIEATSTPLVHGTSATAGSDGTTRENCEGCQL